MEEPSRGSKATEKPEPWEGRMERDDDGRWCFFRVFSPPSLLFLSRPPPRLASPRLASPRLSSPLSHLQVHRLRHLLRARVLDGTRVFERLEQELVGEEVDRELLVPKRVHARGRAAGRGPHFEGDRADGLAQAHHDLAQGRVLLVLHQEFFQGVADLKDGWREEEERRRVRVRVRERGEQRPRASCRRRPLFLSRGRGLACFFLFQFSVLVPECGGGSS